MGILNWEQYFFITCLSQYSLWHFLFSGKQRNIVRPKHPNRNIFTDTNRCPSMKPMKWLIVIFTSTTTSASRQRPEWRRWRCATPLKLHIAYMGLFVLTAQTGVVQFAERVLFARLCEFRRFVFCIYSFETERRPNKAHVISMPDYKRKNLPWYGTVRFGSEQRAVSKKVSYERWKREICQRSGSVAEWAVTLLSFW